MAFGMPSLTLRPEWEERSWMRRSFTDFFGKTPTPVMYMVEKGLVSKGPAVSPRLQASCRDVETMSGCWEAEGRFGMRCSGGVECSLH